MRQLFILLLLAAANSLATTHETALKGLLERIDPGLSEKIVLNLAADSDSTEWFEISQLDWRPVIKANTVSAMGVGINHYMKYVAGKHLSWNAMTASMPDTLPRVDTPIRRSTDMPMRYYLNYCTHSYSMAFWDWERWQQEIDWMVLHGINMPLAITGAETLWRNVLHRLGYPEQGIQSFIAGPAFQAWWLMNNLEGWGGPNPDEYYQRQFRLQSQILERIRQFDMQPVLPGYSGMLPHDAASQLGVDAADPGLWLGYQRPSFLQPTDEKFDDVAAIYYDELHRLYGTSRYYSMDPFHEGGATEGVDLKKSGKKLLATMRRYSPDAVWVVQGWQENPRTEMIENLPVGSVAVLDLQGENVPMWRMRGNGFDGHNWLYCMLLNFGGNVGLYGKIDAMINGFNDARTRGENLRGVGLTMEGIENNPVMFELLCELPWEESPVDRSKWISHYAKARYGGRYDQRIDSAWQLLARSVYNCPDTIVQQGPTESLFCARPSDNPRQASSWANSHEYYDFDDVDRAATLMAEAADEFADNPNFVYDLIDITRQAVANRGRTMMKEIKLAADRGDKEAYQSAANRFLGLIRLQDTLLATHPSFRLGTWLEAARNGADTESEKDRREWNARTQITTWGNRAAANEGGLHDYANREWQGLLKDFYLPRWQRWFDARLATWDSTQLPEIDFYAMEHPWTMEHNHYSSMAESEPIEMARYAIRQLKRLKSEAGALSHSPTE